MPSTSPSFEVASVRMVENHSADLLARGIEPSLNSFPANRVFYHDMPLRILIAAAYGVDSKNVVGIPELVDEQLYDIDAKVEGDRQLTYEQVKPLLQNLVAERFHLAAHHETKLISGFALVIAKGGPKLQPSKGEDKRYGQAVPDGLQAWNSTIKAFSGLLSIPARAPVVDKTGLTGHYDIHLSYAPADDPDLPVPSLFTALQKQLGLK
ncbi:MAG TPA: TIGR03435 family protein, partial [Acidobacteriaceae bacterium]|nr:TIGR03435 family protein [Acidobacteriaceae bacterium]